MKIVLRGMKGTGKTSLFEVFQGHACPDKYIPSSEINTTQAYWTNPQTKERVKVDVFSLLYNSQIEIWDVVDQASVSEKDQVSIDKLPGTLSLRFLSFRNDKERQCSEW